MAAALIRSEPVVWPYHHSTAQPMPPISGPASAQRAFTHTLFGASFDIA